MDTSKLHNITNNYRDVRLISLSKWKQAREFEDRDHGGPYVIAQQGYDPQDIRYIPTDFVLGRSGNWLPLSIFFTLPVEERRKEFIFSTASQVMELMQHLPSKAKIMAGSNVPTQVDPTGDDLNVAVLEGEGLIAPVQERG
jgi:hypothetical protein